MSKMKLMLDVVHDLHALANSLEALTNAAIDEASEPDAVSDVSTEAPVSKGPKLTIVELRAFVAERSTPENRPKIRALIETYGVNKLTELSEDKYEAIMREVEAL